MKVNKSGISLIVLVITIIVIIILAVAVILSIASNNPIENANKAKAANNEKTLEEVANLVYSDWYTKSKLNQTTDDPVTYVERELSAQGIDAQDITKVLTTMLKTENGKSLVTIPNGFVVSEVPGENSVSKGLVIYEGTERVTEANVEEAKTTRNQFVWVPVSNIKEFIREDLTKDDTSLSASYEEPYSNASDDEKNEYAAMIKSVEKYGGFYISRYEASKSTDGNVQSQKNKSCWSIVKWANNMEELRGGAVEAARNKFKEEEANDEGDPVSTLCYGVQWDQTVRFIMKNYNNIEKDSTSYGNYATSKLIYTGTNDAYVQNNIYDMCGNVYEWTMEAVRKDGKYQRVPRGGACTNSVSISYRSSSLPDYTNWNLGFRIALYIK